MLGLVRNFSDWKRNRIWKSEIFVDKHDNFLSFDFYHISRGEDLCGNFRFFKKKKPKLFIATDIEESQYTTLNMIDIEWEVLSTNRKVISAREGIIFLITRKLDRRAL